MTDHWEESRKSFSLLSLHGEESAAKKPSTGLSQSATKTLANLLGVAETQLPAVESNPEIQRFLDQFARRLEYSTEVERMKQDHIKELIQEYQLEELRLQEELKLVGITKDTLSNECQRKLTFLARIADGLDLRSTRFSFILAKWSELCLRHFSMEENERLVKSVFDACALMKERTLEMKEKATGAFEELSKATGEEVLSSQTQGEAKIQQYKTEAEAFKETLEQQGFNDKISHHELKNRAQHLDGIKHEISIVTKELSEYDTQLPRDMEAAKACLNDVQKELSNVTATLRTKIVQD